VISFSSAAVVSHCVSGSIAEEYAKKIDEIEEMKRKIEQRSRETGKQREGDREEREVEQPVVDDEDEQPVVDDEVEQPVVDDEVEQANFDEVEQAEVFSHESTEEEEVSSDAGEAPPPPEFLVDAYMFHELLGECTVKKGPRDEDGKVLIQWTRPRKGVRGRAKGTDTFNQWVLASSLKVSKLFTQTEASPVDTPAAGETEASPADPPAAGTGASTPINARGTSRTPVLPEEANQVESLGPAPELAAHERDRSIPQKRPARLGSSGNCRSTPSKVSVQARCDEFNGDDKLLRLSFGAIFCVL
jgi:hypothetical protein